MAEKPAAPNEEIPAFRVSEKKVDDSWKEEVRRERERAAAAAPAAGPQAAPLAAGAPKGAQAGERRPKQAPEPEARREKRGSQAEQQQSRIFVTFLGGLVQQALMQLGDIPSPFSGQREVDLQGARYTIELLGTLQVKTKNNLNEEEEEALTGSIGDLKMRYVEIANEVQRQMQAEVQKDAARGPARPGPGGTIPGPGYGKRK
jgi:hypothetical protein